MGRELTPAEVKELLGAYALGALEDDEREQVEQLVLNDQDARAELHALQLGAAWLARSDLRPAPRVWDAIRTQMDAEEDELAARRRRRGRRLVAAAVAAVIAIGAVVAVTSLDSGGPGAPSVDTAARAAIRDPDADRFALRAPDGTVAARLAVYPDGRGYFLDAGLAPLEGSRTYELWGISEDGPTPEAVLGPSPTAARFGGRAELPAIKYAITIEREGGSRAPHGAFVASTGVQ
ncbi:MAG TPA: anti-sigma factor [Acidimicrobiia bacterium]